MFINFMIFIFCIFYEFGLNFTNGRMHVYEHGLFMNELMHVLRFGCFENLIINVDCWVVWQHLYAFLARECNILSKSIFRCVQCSQRSFITIIRGLITLNPMPCYLNFYCLARQFYENRP